MPQFSVRKSTFIDAPAEKVFATVRDFKKWGRWSPWVIAEPDCQISFSEDGKSYSWDGEIIGSGEIAVTGEVASRSIDYQLTFLKPWKSVSSVRFLFEEKSGATEVTWSMDSALPWFLFFLKSMMTAFVGSDYERGLSMLKDEIETGSVPLKLDFPGQGDFPGLAYVGIKTACPVTDIGPRMDADMGKLQTLFAARSTVSAGPPVSIYHHWNMVKGTAVYTVGFPVDSLPADLPAGFTSGRIPACRTYRVRHTGPYRHLGNAWAAGMMHGRAKVFRQNKAIPPFEIYETGPDEAAPNDLATLLHFPVKA